MIGSVIRRALGARQNPRILELERRVRSAVPPLDRAAKRAYARFREQRLVAATRDAALRRALLDRAPLPAGFGRGMDERLVEYAWVLARLEPARQRILDAGSTLNHRWVSRHPSVRSAEVVVYTLAPEGVLGARNFSYIYGDLRDTILRDACMDAVVCISTLEHVGLDNTAYTGEDRDAAMQPGSFVEVVREFRRLLRPGGLLLVTVPYGQPENLGWLQQFDAEQVAALRSAFAGQLEAEDYFRHDPTSGWQRSSAAASADARFLWVRGKEGRAAVATMATAIACLALRRASGPPA
ncbi:MAG: methyltransferase domain-containing protein [Longimicrobiales bacterium]